MYPKPHPSQNPIPKGRNADWVDSFKRSRHAGTTHVTQYDGREKQREYSPDQTFETLTWGHENPDPKGDPDVSIFKLNSIGHPGTRRRIVANTQERVVITALPREEIPQQAPRPSAPASSTKKKKKEQKLRKQQRSREANGG